MASKSGKPSKNGTLIRGADGHLYFIPDSHLPAYAVPEKGAAETEAKLREWEASGKKGALHAVRGRIGILYGVEFGSKTPVKGKLRSK